MIIKFKFYSRTGQAVYNTKRLTNLERSKITLDDNLEQVLVDNILGDVYMRRRFATQDSITKKADRYRSPSLCIEPPNP